MRSFVSHLGRGDLPKQQKSNDYKLKMPYLIIVILSPSSVGQSFCAFQTEATTEQKQTKKPNQLNYVHKRLVYLLFNCFYFYSLLSVLADPGGSM